MLFILENSHKNDGSDLWKEFPFITLDLPSDACLLPRIEPQIFEKEWPWEWIIFLFLDSIANLLFVEPRRKCWRLKKNSWKNWKTFGQENFKLKKVKEKITKGPLESLEFMRKWFIKRCRSSRICIQRCYSLRMMKSKR